jgi:transposase
VVRGQSVSCFRRLEKGTFAFPTAGEASVVVTPTQLAMILGGLDPAKARDRRRYKTPA